MVTTGNSTKNDNVDDLGSFSDPEDFVDKVSDEGNLTEL